MKHSLEILADRMEDKFKREEKKEIARKMRAEGIDVDTVARLTDLTVDDVLQL